MELQQRHIDAFDRAEALILERDYAGYLELKGLLSDASPATRSRFRTLFTNYYGMNTGGLSETFKDRFFEILFSDQMFSEGRLDLAPVLNELSLIPGRRGFCAMPFSFVSKLAAIHREDSPIFDRHVTGFFAVGAPAASVPKPDRIHWFIEFLAKVDASYARWAGDDRVVRILNRFKSRDFKLASCHNNRLLDFMVWKVGNQKLLS